MTATITTPVLTSRAPAGGFPEFARHISRRWQRLSAHELYTVDPENLNLPEVYLAAFPPGTDPIFRTHTEHDCRCCLQFLKQVGGVVSIVDGHIRTLWEKATTLPEPYATVAAALDAAVRAAPITSVFRTSELNFGRLPNLDAHDTRITWTHFHVEVLPRHRASAVGSTLNACNTKAASLHRALTDFTPEAVRTVLELIDANTLYRGAEFRSAVDGFAHLQANAPEPALRQLYAWEQYMAPSAGIRSTVIGTLLDDLSSGKPLEQAVASFESKVAPLNYKRPTAVVTPRMVDQALATIRTAGLEPALARRLATLEDLSVTDVLWASGSAAPRMRDPLRDLLLESTPKTPRNISAGATISPEDFLALRPREISLVLTGFHLPNFLALTAPVHPDAPPLFQWDNNFGWSYTGGTTDSIKARVAKAGGNVNALLRASLAWFNRDDLDIHCLSPRGHIYFGNRADILDVDMNASSFDLRRDPVENLSWTAVNLMDGAYKIFVHQYNSRETVDKGFQLQLEYDGRVRTYSSNAALRTGQQLDCFSFTVSSHKVENLCISPALTSEADTPVTHWGVSSHTPIPVDTIMLSPNHWQGAGARGNKHWIFALQGCRSPEPVRGLYNEFLRPGLLEHRKVFELLGSRTLCPVTDNHLAGVGFSSTQPNTVTALADGRPYTITFGATNV